MPTHAARIAVSAITLSGVVFCALPAAAQDSTLDAVLNCATQADANARLACYDRAVGELRAAQASGDIVAVERGTIEEVQRDGFGFSLPSVDRLRGLLGGKPEAGDAAARAPQPDPAALSGREALTSPVQRPSPAPAPALAAVPETPPTAAVVEPVRQAEAQARSARPAPPADIKAITVPLIGVKEYRRGRQRFFLENGQIWDQVDGSPIRLPRKWEPGQFEARISRGVLRSYTLKVDGRGSAVKVRRRR